MESTNLDDVKKFVSEGAVHAVVMMLKHCGVKYVGIRTLSVSSLLHGKDIILDYHDVHNESNAELLLNGVSIFEGFQGIPLTTDALPPETGLNGTNGLRLVGDLKTLRILPYNQERAVMFGNLFNPNGKSSELCCRHSLQKQMGEFARNNDGMKVTVGAELEFVLFRKDEKDPCTQNAFMVSSDMDDLGYFIKDAVKMLDAQNVQLETIHAEAEAGQFELVLKYSDPLTIAENIITCRETLRQVAIPN